MKKKVDLCHCGKPLHYSNKEAEFIVRMMVTDLGENIRVTTGGRTWLVQRHYIALHGIKAKDLPNLGFKEVSYGTKI